MKSGVSTVLMVQGCFSRFSLKKFNFDDIESIGEKGFAYCPKIKVKRLPDNIKIATDAYLKS